MAEALPYILPSPSDVESDLARWRIGDPALDALLQRAVDPVHALRHRGLRLAGAGETGPAIQAFANGLALSPHDAGLWADLAFALHSNADYEDARRCLERSLALKSTQPRAWLFLAGIHTQAGDLVAAEQAHLEALKGEPHLAEASFGLGLIHFQTRRFDSAARHLENAIDDGVTNLGAFQCLGQARFFIGDFPGAVAALAPLAAAATDNEMVRRKYALYRLVDQLITASVPDALEDYRETAGPFAEDRDAITRSAFEVLSNYGHIEAAKRLGAARLEWAPDDIIHRHHMDVLSGATFDRAPPNYIVEYYDRFAETFDTRLVHVLGYRVPETLVELLTPLTAGVSVAADIGCGTGLAGPLLRPMVKRLIGIDLSPGMLRKAKLRETYDHLIEGDLLSYLETEDEPLDLLFAADVLIYLGDVAPLMTHAAARLKKGGFFAFSLETTEQDDYVLSASGRFAHRRSYIEAVASPNFTVAAASDTIVRLEANRPVEGALYVIQRR